MIDFGLGKLRLCSAAAACAGLFMTQAAGTHPAAFTLNDVMQAPFPSYMLAAPKGAAVARAWKHRQEHMNLGAGGGAPPGGAENG